MLRLSFLLLLFPPWVALMLLGWVESPGYPGGYLPHTSLNWSRCAPKGHILSIRLIHLDLENSLNCENDAVKVYSDEDLLSVLCGVKSFKELESTVNPTLMSPPGGCLKLQFHSDYSNPRRHSGFRGFYTIQDFDECRDDPDSKCTHFCHNYVGGHRCSCRHGYLLADDQHTCTVSCTKDLSGLKRGEISTPAWPKTYPENANCEYTLAVESHLQLELHFSDVFDVEQRAGGECSDALKIVTQSETLGPFCGNTPPPSPLSTYSNHVQILFTSDDVGDNKGFRLRFNTRERVCKAVVGVHSKLTPAKEEYRKGETVMVTCDEGFVVNSGGVLALSTRYEATCLSSGEWHPSFPCEIVNCGLPEVEDNSILELVNLTQQKTQYNEKVQFKCSSEYYKLEGHDTYTCNGSGHWVSSAGRSDLPKCIEVCGETSNAISGAGRILGGTNASLGELPWQLWIRSPRTGGASLISDRWAVTAAHVVDGVEETSLRLFGGVVHTHPSSLHKLSPLISERIIIHCHYAKGNSGSRTNYDNDIALVKFDTRVNLGPNLRPICLPQVDRGVLENEQGTVSGWGGTGVKRSSLYLLYAHISVYPLEQCRNTPVLPGKGQMNFTDNMFCAGAPGGDSCKGDSGGPFVLPMLSAAGGPYHLAGVVSWGPLCKSQAHKGYYTKVQNYVKWIKVTIGGS